MVWWCKIEIFVEAAWRYTGNWSSFNELQKYFFALKVLENKYYLVSLYLTVLKHFDNYSLRARTKPFILDVRNLSSTEA